MDDADAATSGAAAADGGGAARRGGAPPKAKRVVKPLTRAKLEDFQAAQENRGPQAPQAGPVRVKAEATA